MEAGAGPTGDAAIVDVDATIVWTRSYKEDDAPTHKRTYGHHPLPAMLAETGEVLGRDLPAGQRGSQLRRRSRRRARRRHRPAPRQLAGRPPAGRRPRHGHEEAAGPHRFRRGSHWFAEECRARNIGFTLGYWIDRRVGDAVLLVPEEDWEPAREAGGRSATAPRQSRSPIS